LQLPEIKRVEEYLKARDFRFASDIHIRPNSNVVLISIPESALGPKVTATTTSHRKLTFLKQQFAADAGLTVEFIVIRGSVQNQIEARLNALLNSQFPKIIKEAFLSFRGDAMYDVWLDPVDSIGDSDRAIKVITATIVKYLKVFDFELGVVQFTDFESLLPSFGVILRRTKKLAPTTAAHLLESFDFEGVKIPSHTWLDRKLDTLRKRGRLIRLPDGKYSLTESALNTVPHGKSRGSSDIERALALGRRKW
jgi:hypothetical protein